MPLVEDGLLRGINGRDQLLRVVLMPEQLVALEPADALGSGAHHRQHRRR
jgi:hypothetical protein